MTCMPSIAMVALAVGAATPLAAESMSLETPVGRFVAEALPDGLVVSCRSAAGAFDPVAEPGIVFADADHKVCPSEYAARLVSSRIEEGVLRAEYEAAIGGRTARWTLAVRLQSDGVVVVFDCDDPRARGAAAGWCRGIGAMRELKTGRYGEQGGDGQLRAYWLQDVRLWAFGEWDLDAGNFAQVSLPVAGGDRPQLAGDQVYIPRLDGSVPPVHEELRLRFSEDLWQAIGPLPNAPSPFAEDLRTMVFLDFWDGAFDRERKLLEWIEANTGGLYRFVTIVHDWQTPGYDTNMPEVMPPNQSLGGTEAMRRLLEAGNRLGRIGLHNNYLVTGPKGGIAEQAGARPFVMPGGNVAEALSGFRPVPISMVEPVRRIEPEVHALGTSAAHFDEHATCGLPAAPDWAFGLNFETQHPDECMARTLIRGFRESSLAAKGVHQGPLFTETGLSEYLVGYVDACDYGVIDGTHRVLWPDYKLHRIQPLMACYGMGLYYRYFLRDFSQPWTLPGDSDAAVDDYRAAQMLYGNGAYVFATYRLPPEFLLTEIGLVGTLQPYYFFEPVERIEYLGDDGAWRSLAELVQEGMPLDRRFVARDLFANGYTVVVNRTDAEVPMPTPRGAAMLPPNSFVAWMGDGLFAYSAIGPGMDFRTDYAEDRARGIRFVNPRGHEALGVATPTLWHDGSVVCQLEAPAPPDGKSWHFPDAAASDPTGPWAMGVRAEPGGEFAPLEWSQDSGAWRVSADTTVPIVRADGFLHPTVEKTVVVRFMAPSAGDFRCRVTLTSSDPRGGDGLSVSVVLGDATLASGLFPNGGEVTLEAPFREVFYDPQSLEIRVGSRESAACDSAFVRVDVSPK